MTTQSIKDNCYAETKTEIDCSTAGATRPTEAAVELGTLPQLAVAAEAHRLGDGQVECPGQTEGAFTEGLGARRASLPRFAGEPWPSGVTRVAGRLIRRTLRRIELAIGHGDKHPDGNIRREAWRFLRACQSLPFDRIVQRSSEFRGQLNKAGHRRRERALREAAWRCSLGGSWELVQVTTVAWLRSVGRSLGLCVARCDETGRHYHTALREGGFTFHTLQRDGVPQCLIEVDAATNEVNATEGSADGPVPLTHRRALNILRALGATADGVAAFANVGAFSPYLGAAKSVRLCSTVGRHRYVVDAFPSVPALVVHETPCLPSRRAREKRERWSLFEPEPTRGTQKLAEWREVSDSENSLSVGELLDLLLHDRELAEATRRLFVKAG